MIHQFEHRAASVEVNAENLHNPALSDRVSLAQHQDPNFVPEPQFWVSDSEVVWPDELSWLIGFRDIARATDARTVISAIVPFGGYSNKLLLLRLPPPLGTNPDKQHLHIHSQTLSINTR